MLDTVAGVALLAGAGLLVVLAVMAQVGARRAARAAQRPARVFATVIADIDGRPHGGVDLAGTLTNPATERGPMSDQPCLLWRVLLLQRDASGEETTWDPVWTADGRGDLVVEYDLRKEGPGRPVSWPGRLTIPARQVRWYDPTTGRVPGGPGTGWRPAEIPLLADLGLPDEWAGRIAAGPREFLMVEQRIGPGDLVHLRQAPSPYGGELPDPQAPFTVSPTSPERIAASGLGCLVPLLLGGALLLVCQGLQLFD
jgi:hypothetical protein